MRKPPRGLANGVDCATVPGKMRMPFSWRGLVALVLLLLAVPLAFSDAAAVALWPSLVALTTVVLLRRVLAGLMAGAAAGALLLNAGNPVTAFVALFGDHLLPALESSWKVGAILFTFTLGGFAALLERGGGFHGLVAGWLRKGRNADQRVLWGGFGLGLVCFFDGLANSMMVGRLLRGFGDRFGIPRVKLAYLVDSTSSAVACVAFVSTWIAYQLAMIREGFANAGRPDEAMAYGRFFASIPYNFYCWFTLVLLALVIARRWDIGPMRRFVAEARPQTPSEEETAAPHGPGWVAWGPLVVLLAAIFGGLYVSGADPRWPLTLSGVADAFGSADAALVLVVASALAALVAYLVYPRAVVRHDPAAAPGPVFLAGAQSLFMPVTILLAAWMLSSTLQALEAGPVLTALLSGALPPALLPAAVFLTGALISFTTGTSWGTMGLLMPLAIPVTLGLAPASALPPDALVAAVIGAVFSGAVFGDHCSPMSDTTIVSSVATGVEPHDHVRTQLPYALLAALTAVVTGFLPVGLGLSPWLGLPLGIGALGALVLFTSRRN